MANKKWANNRNEEIIASIAGAAIGGIDGISGLTAVAAEHIQVHILEDDRAFIDVNINIVLGHSVPDMSYEVQTKIKADIEDKTKFKVEKINVNILGVVMENEE